MGNVEDNSDPSPATAKQCQMCDFDLPNPDKEFIGYDDLGIATGTTCQVLENYGVLLDADIVDCRKLRNFGGFAFCGCVKEYDYLNAKTRSQKEWLIVAPMISGVLSILGSLYITQDILRSWKKFGILKVRDQFLLGISVFDMVGSLARSLGPIPQPEILKTGLPLGVLGASGTYATCRAQGFFMHLGLTSKSNRTCY